VPHERAHDRVDLAFELSGGQVADQVARAAPDRVHGVEDLEHRLQEQYGTGRCGPMKERCTGGLPTWWHSTRTSLRGISPPRNASGPHGRPAGATARFPGVPTGLPTSLPRSRTECTPT